MTDVGKDDLMAAHAAIKQYLIDQYNVPGQGVSIETIIGAVASLTGEWALMSQHPDELPEGGYVMSDQVNDLVLERDQNIWDRVVKASVNFGADPTKLPDKLETVKNIANSVGGSYPPLSIPRENYPNEWSPNAGPKHRDAIKAIGDKHGLDDEHLMMVLTEITVDMLHQASQMMPVEVMTTLALELIVAVSKMRPLEESIS